MSRGKIVLPNMLETFYSMPCMRVYFNPRKQMSGLCIHSQEVWRMWAGGRWSRVETEQDSMSQVHLAFCGAETSTFTTKLQPSGLGAETSRSTTELQPSGLVGTVVIEGFFGKKFEQSFKQNKIFY